MSAQSNKDLQNRVYGLFSTGKEDDVLAHATTDVVVEMIPFGQVHRGHGGFREFLSGFKTAFPDLRIEVTRQIAEGDRVTAEFVAYGTHSGPLMTPGGAVPATGKAVTFTVCEVWDIRDGQIAGIRNYQDAASLMRQLGLA